ncbi:DUF6414 family protein [Nocardiopsis dassonvillei]|uniref:DUF6414 family protein n=1 Tax=Nocardiopsis dassonvillei TaxID=2014 RepID=UPI00366D1075
MREYIYVDADKVRGLASQLYDGVPEKATRVSARQKKLQAGVKVIRGEGSSSSEDAVEKSLGDSIFKDLEADLEALELLIDASEKLQREETWEDIDSLASPGSILRITAPGTLFHPAQISEAIVGMATSAHGLFDLGSSKKESTPVVPPKAKSGNQRKTPKGTTTIPQGEHRNPEDYLPEGDIIPIMNMPRQSMAGMIRIIRGVFGEGVHLHLRPLGVDGPTVSARLESGRRFFDSSPEVLLSRYGLSPQEWTIVGITGQLGDKISPDEFINITNADDSVNRAKVVDLVHQFLGQTAGLIDIPQKPGFSMVPLAVYRTIGKSISTQLEPAERGDQK